MKCEYCDDVGYVYDGAGGMYECLQCNEHYKAVMDKPSKEKSIITKIIDKLTGE